MNQTVLHAMYQAWQQDNDTFVQDWSVFVEMAGRELRRSPDEIIRQLQTYSWFRWTPHAEM